MCIDEFNGDNFDHGPHGFVGGGYMGAVQTNGRPILEHARAAGHAALGRAVEEGGRRELSQQLRGGRRMAAATATATSISTSIRPTPTAYGRKLMRITFDFHDNELKMSQYLTDRLAEIVQKMGPRQIEKKPRTGPYDDHAVPDDAYLRRRRHGHRSQDQRAQPLSAELGRAQSLRHGRHRLPAECRLQPHRTRSGRSLIGRPMPSSSQYLKNPGPLVQLASAGAIA